MVRDSKQAFECVDAFKFINSLEDGSVHLLLTDPPYFQIVRSDWDRQWSGMADYVEWFVRLLRAVKPKLTPDASVLFFGGIGSHAHRPFFRLIEQIEHENLYHARNLLTWQKRRAYGKQYDYLFCREEIAWYSVSNKRTEVRFNIPLTNIKRGYAGFNPKYPARSEYKRVSNVITDIPELFRPEREAEKPVQLMRRLIQTHSHPGDLVVDPFCGLGATGIAAVESGRRFRAADRDAEAIARAEAKLAERLGATPTEAQADRESDS